MKETQKERRKKNTKEERNKLRQKVTARKDQRKNSKYVERYCDCMTSVLRCGTLHLDTAIVWRQCDATVHCIKSLRLYDVSVTLRYTASSHCDCMTSVWRCGTLHQDTAVQVTIFTHSIRNGCSCAEQEACRKAGIISLLFLTLILLWISTNICAPLHSADESVQ